MMHALTLALVMSLYVPHPVSGQGIAVPQVGDVTHIVLGLQDGAYRVISGVDSLEAQSVEWSLRFGSRVVSPTSIERETD